MTANQAVRSAMHDNLIGWFVVLSVLAHVIFLNLVGNEPEKHVHVNLSSPLQVTVMSLRQDHRSVRLEPLGKIPAIAEKKAVVSKANPLPLSAKAAEKSIASGSNGTLSTGIEENEFTEVDKASSAGLRSYRETEVAAQVTETTAAVTSKKNASLNHLREQLKNMIEARFTYPRMARRMGWEGLVGLSLHIEDDGSLNQVRIARSSGHRILDQNAQKTVQDIGHIEVASNLAIQAVDTEIEVLYRLVD